MSDPSVELLAQQLHDLEGKCLIVADENWDQAPWMTVAQSGSASRMLRSNRYEIALAAEQAGVPTQFSDFDFSDLEAASFDNVLFRVSKERAVSHHIINQASVLLKRGGMLMLSGEKTDGVKTYARHACRLFGDSCQPQKLGNYYLARLTNYRDDQKPLDDKNYLALRPIGSPDNLPLQSKPGIFGWNKIDQGSALLLNQLPHFLQSFGAANQPQSLLDLGCGYGFLACAAAQQGFTQITATDNNAAALRACKANFAALEIDGTVIAGDAGSQIEERFDAIICNPPFHQGFNIDSELTAKFLLASKRLLAPRGRALFVVNNFIALEKKAQDYFPRVREVARSGSFKLIMVSFKD
ncbi:methyltransferase [Porticoccaceae bacterium]|nr:methyltransferase [Porticoccaceae bacterium]